MNTQSDVDVIDRDMLDDNHQLLHSKPWLVQFENGEILYFDSEDAACNFQLDWRIKHSINQELT